jgi:hypothetical protein
LFPDFHIIEKLFYQEFHSPNSHFREVPQRTACDLAVRASFEPGLQVARGVPRNQGHPPLVLTSFSGKNLPQKGEYFCNNANIFTYFM